MRIGIDIDDTITDTNKVYQKYLRKYCRQERLDYVPGMRLNKEDYLKLFQKNNILSKVKPKKDVKKVLQKWNQLGYKIYIITAREPEKFPNIEETTKRFFQELEVQYEKIIFAAKDKYEEAKAFHLDVYIDDQERVLDKFPKNNITLLRMMNQKDFYSKYQKVTSWKEIETIIDHL